ncbi:hypothetical protein QYF61_022306 [Mycteria americana]|uniref:Uncharacterized protein n=1 Tax=Mycteria americana TaxID=33587 RepID=A0AAN7RR44_MYCAM|nr:hypothetical protein QYF61_022306 [Mycteria americana]
MQLLLGWTGLQSWQPRGLAKCPQGRRGSPLPHTPLFTPVKSPGREQKNKRKRRGKGAKRRQGRQPAVEPSPEPELESDPQPDPQEEAEPSPSKPPPPELVPQEQLPVLTIEDVVSVMQQGAVEGELATGSQDPTGELLESCWPRGGSGGIAVPPPEDCQPRLPTLSTTNPWHHQGTGPYPTKRVLGGCERGEEEVLKPAEAEVPEALNTPPENDQLQRGGMRTCAKPVLWELPVAHEPPILSASRLFHLGGGPTEGCTVPHHAAV